MGGTNENKIERKEITCPFCNNTITIQGELIFKSFEEAFNFVKKPTNYEKKKGIKIKDVRIIVDLPDIKLVERETDDGRYGLFIFFKNSTVFDIWKFWMPSEAQWNFLREELPAYLYEISKKSGDIEEEETDDNVVNWM